MADAFDDLGYTEMTGDEVRAQRLLSLALAFTNRSTPLTSEQVQESIYPEISRETFSRVFRRDRKALAGVGVIIVSTAGKGESGEWVLDASRSLAGVDAISARDALVLDVACGPLVADPSFPYADELALALAKIDRSFEWSLPGGAASPAPTDSSLRVVRRCFDAGHAARIEYVDARGTASKRVIAPYGLFGLRGHVYCVAARVEDGVVDDTPHVYRVDRMSSAEPVPQVTYTIPGDFSVEDYVVLPFQIGPTRGEASFVVPDLRSAEVIRDARGRGTWEDAAPLRWTVPYSDLDAAATWAVAEGIRPTAPAELVRRYERLLEGAMDRVR